MLEALPLVLLFAGLLAFNELFRRSRVAAILAFVVFPIVMTPYWLRTVHFDWFLWAKLYSVIFGIAVIQSFRFTSLGDKPWMTKLLGFVLFANILEAVIQDATSPGLMHTLNALAGVLLIVSMPSTSRIRTDEHSPRDMLWDMDWTWILGYTLWNWMFVNMNFNEGSVRHIAILVVPLVATLYSKKAIWLECRAFILGVDLLVKFTDESTLALVPTPSALASERVAQVGVPLGLGFILVHVVRSRLASRAERDPAVARAA